MGNDGRDIFLIFGWLSLSTRMILFVSFIEDDFGNAFKFGADA